MHYGISAANLLWPCGPEVADISRAAESLGFESIWAVEHVVFPHSYASTYPYSPDGRMPAEPATPFPDPLIWLTHVGAATSTIGLATGILVLPQRHPVVLAKEVATLDSLVGGRMQLGVGVGWLKEEFEALGIPFEQRGEMMDDYIAAIRTLWSGNSVSYSSRFVRFDDVSSSPRPTGRLPIVIGGDSVHAAKRAGRLGDGYFPAQGSPRDIELLVDVVRQSAADANRDPLSIELTCSITADFATDPVGGAQELAALGIARVLVPAFAFLEPNPIEALAEFQQRVIGPTRSIS
jgi:probable F420-dependent oxidoreductase